ncbi:MAG: ribosome silencing factor [Bacteroidales bacterium]|nr:ribosome silencing factor [Bacteroidales bacterium]
MRVRHQSDNAEQIVATVVETMDAMKGKEIVTLDLRETGTAVTDYFVICHANSKTQVDAIADKITDTVQEKLHVKPYHVEGRDNTEWILIDYVDVVVHVFLQSMRSFYQLEELWADAERIVTEERD